MKEFAKLYERAVTSTDPDGLEVTLNALDRELSQSMAELDYSEIWLIRQQQTRARQRLNRMRGARKRGT